MAKGKNGQLNGGRELAMVTQEHALLGSLLQKIITAINTTAQNASVSSVGKLPPPPPIDTHDLQGSYDATTNTFTAPGEILHYTLVHNQSIRKGVQYLSEISTDPNFSSPHPIDHGASRSAFVNLPAMDNDGNQQVYYLRSLSQYHGSNPSEKTVFGGQNGPIKIVMTGSNKGTLLQGQGSGTAKNGQQGGRGLGTVLTRPAPGPQRNLKAK